MTAPRNKASVLLEGLGAIDLDATLFGGQTFRWRRESESTVEGWIGDRPVRVVVRREGLAVLSRNGDNKGLADAAHRYFDASRNYAALRRRLHRDARLPREVPGLRILRQPAFETVITFIASANNNIVRIGRTINTLAELAGARVEADGTMCHAFPTAEQLAALSMDDLRGPANLGYRDEYVYDACRLVAAGEVDLAAIDALDNEALRVALCRLPGVGPKVSDCIALFAYGRLDVFPVDTWIRKSFIELYLEEGETATDRTIGEMARKRFGACAGLAQQILFESARRANRKRA